MDAYPDFLSYPQKYLNKLSTFEGMLFLQNCLSLLGLSLLGRKDLPSSLPSFLVFPNLMLSDGQFFKSYLIYTTL